MADLRRDAGAGSALSLYLKARDFHKPIVTLTEEGAIVLGPGIDNSLNEPGVEAQASDSLAALMKEFGTKAGISGVELAPPQSAEEWADDGLGLMRVRTI